MSENEQGGENTEIEANKHVSTSVTRLPLSKRSQMSMRTAFVSNGQLFDKCWSSATNAPMFSKKPITTKSGKIIKRANHMLNSHVFKTFSSIAGANAARVATKEASMLRNSSVMPAEDPKAPFMPSIGRSFINYSEHVNICYIKAVLARAHALRLATATPKGKIMHKKLTANCVQAAAAAINADLFDSTGYNPNVVLPPKIRTHNSKSTTGTKKKDVASTSSQ
tara:strand:+ start:485 stop:1153 length:669 start_codon:yes stop_codon:yes gene_type:complete